MDSLQIAIGKMDSWFKSVRQPRGYGGPVAHWWQHCILYTGPGIDWRYEGLLAGYHLLYKKTGQLVWKQRIRQAAEDVIGGQLTDGSYVASQFEMNPGTLGTPHEAAATLGLLTAFETLQDERIVDVARRNLDHLIDQLWDDKLSGFNDRPGIRGRVPNKLATLAECLISFYKIVGEERYLYYAQVALDSVLTYQLKNGAIHQYGHGAGHGDDKFFPFYNARCISPFLQGAEALGQTEYREAATQTLSFLQSTMNPDGSWDQIVYRNGKRVRGPQWIAGAADILRAYQLCGETVPEIALQRVLGSQLESGGFPTAEGFSHRFGRTADKPMFHDIVPVVGWNDKIFRFLVEQLPDKTYIPLLPFVTAKRDVVGGRYVESLEHVQVLTRDGQATFYWNKQQPWSQCVLEGFA